MGSMQNTPTPRDWPEGLPVPDSWLRFDADGQLDNHGWTAPAGHEPTIIAGGFGFTRALSEEERAAALAYLTLAYHLPDLR